MNKFLEKTKELFQKTKPFFEKIGKLLSPIKSFWIKYSEIFNPIVVLTVICIIIAAALSLTNMLTENRIAAINQQNKVREMQLLLPADEYKETTLSEFESDKNFSFNSAVKDNESIGYLVTTSKKGYGGDVVVLTAFNNDGSVKSVSIISAADETPGLGQNVTKDTFLSRFAGLKTKLTLVKNQADTEKGEVEAWTGATLSSRAVVNAVNDAREALEAFKALPADTENTKEPEGSSEINEITDESSSNTEAGGGTDEKQ